MDFGNHSMLYKMLIASNSSSSSPNSTISPSPPPPPPPPPLFSLPLCLGMYYCSQFLQVEKETRMEEVNPSGDGFSVEDLLDLQEFVEPEKEAEQEERRAEEEEAGPAMTAENSNSSFSSFEIDLPAHDAEELEWVSLIVHDSLFEFPPPLQVTKSTSPTPSIKSKRSKRSRAPMASSSSSSSSSSSYSSSSSSSSSSSLIYVPSLLLDDKLRPPKKPKPKKRGRKPKPPASGGGGGGGERRCTHCGAQKTPQWRAGPQGAKTLCNACGVRYKSGRLLPEYRPACSPTFVSHVHSNSHRRVLEMRRAKESADTQPAVVSF